MKAKAAAERLSAADPLDIESRRRLLSLNGDITQVLVKLNRADEAGALIAQTHADYQALLKIHPDDAALFRAYARSIRPRADVLRAQGNPAQACVWSRSADAAWREFDRRWGISASDKSDEVAAVKADLAKCR